VKRACDELLEKWRANGARPDELITINEHESPIERRGPLDVVVFFWHRAKLGTTRPRSRLL